MSKMHLSIELLENDAIITKKILQAMADEINSRIQQKLSTITYQIQQFTLQFLKATDTYISLVGGELAAQFGLPVFNRQSMIDAIIQKIADNIKIDVKAYTTFGNNFRGGVTFNVLLADFSDILSMVEAFVTTEKGTLLPWLEWLLIRGNQLIISEHEIHLIGGRGRSGMAIMVKNTASAWRVPTQYSGVRGDNWLTRTFKIYQDQYLNQIGIILEKELS